MTVGSRVRVYNVRVCGKRIKTVLCPSVRPSVPRQRARQQQSRADLSQKCRKPDSKQVLSKSDLMEFSLKYTVS